MDVKLSAVIRSPDYEVDMQYGLDSFRGASDVARIVSETLLTDRIRKQTHKNPIRTKLKNSFPSSYGLNFNLTVEGDEARRKLRKIGKDTLAEIMRYYVYEAMYIEVENVSQAALDIIKDLEKHEKKLLERLRNPLKAMHQATRVYQYNFELNYKRPGDNRRIATLTPDTARNLLDASIQDEIEDYNVVITRFNSFTGNGRLLIEGHDETNAFGFDGNYKFVKYATRQLISKNLHTNNGVAAENRVWLRVSARRLALPTGKLVKLMLTGVFP